ncbi:MAG TPA: hypothetical protein VF950_15785 [Planctomycetota bacterium]
MTKTLLCLLAVLTAATPCFADVIPTAYDQKSKADRQAVQARLEGLGSAPAAAELRVRHLSADELAYFAAQPERVQAAGGLYWYEWLGGAVFLGALAVGYFMVTGD